MVLRGIPIVPCVDSKLSTFSTSREDSGIDSIDKGVNRGHKLGKYIFS